MMSDMALVMENVCSSLGRSWKISASSHVDSCDICLEKTRLGGLGPRTGDEPARAFWEGRVSTVSQQFNSNAQQILSNQIM